ncbi:C-X-C motif chemokine 10-like [Carassius auratus]|uniref:C-X-C motif chemokine 10-like n=1 Tax=Carassius auratus TaxID=7957 RepID=A0A6P6JIG3_CARAU|nr:C-X-C motif chemokine 10-like [Carassius auratus]XP_052403015.1 C-X-C motif chemokine 10 [Carassius gibelio]
MAFLPRAILLLLSAVVCIQLSGARGEAIDRCWCLNSLNRYVPKEEIEEFSIFPRRSKCEKVEIILTLKPVNNSPEGIQRCLSPETKQGINLQTCWKNKNINNSPTLKISSCFQI